jgi:hypothetical protein
MMSPAKPTSREEICPLGVKSVGFDMSAACPVSGCRLISEVAARASVARMMAFRSRILDLPACAG